MSPWDQLQKLPTYTLLAVTNELVLPEEIQQAVDQRNARRDGKDRAQAGAVFASDLDEAPIPGRDVVNTDDHSGIAVGIPWYVEVCERGSVVAI